MIRFLSPGFAWALAAPAAILALYLLRRKFLPKQVPSVFLWRRSVRDYAANRPFQKLMKNLLLPLQILAALAAALALMRPALPGGTAGHTVLVFDVSGSMQTVSDGRSRLDEAKEEALELVRSLPPEEEITVLTAGEEARRVLLAGDREQAEKAVASVTCGRGGADFGRALSLADAVAREKEAAGQTRVIVFSDHFRPEDAAGRDRPYIPEIRNCGTAENNRAVYSLTAENGQAYARIANHGDARTVTAVCEADGVLCDAKEVELPAGGNAGVGFAIPEGARRVRVSLRDKDALTADDAAEVPVRHAAVRTAAVTSDSVFLESALRVRPDLTVLRTEEGALAATEADLYILGPGPVVFTRSLPEEGYDPAAGAFGPIRWTAEQAAAPAKAAVELGSNALTEGLTMKNVYFRGYYPLEGGRTAARLDGKPLAAYTEDTVVLGFDPHETNLPLKYDYPVLVQNILDYLLPPETEADGPESSLLPPEESDTRNVAPDYAAETAGTGSPRGRELTGILLAVFLLLLVAEMGVSRYVG